jgi:hypothetical protein
MSRNENIVLKISMDRLGSVLDTSTEKISNLESNMRKSLMISGEKKRRDGRGQGRENKNVTYVSNVFREAGRGRK